MCLLANFEATFDFSRSEFTCFTFTSFLKNKVPQKKLLVHNNYWLCYHGQEN